MPRFSANLGFLWTELSLTKAIHAAKSAGFEAVECHWPYDTPANLIAEALAETGIPMLSINTLRGDVANGENGVSALPGREKEAQSYIEQAIEYGLAIGCKNIHVMAGNVRDCDEAEVTFRENLQYACLKARAHEMTILIEPLNKRVAPHYHLSTLEQAVSTLKAVGRNNLKIMFDCFHLQIMGGNLLNRLQENLEHIGHIQFASVPNRNEPDEGEVNYRWLFEEIDRMGWNGYLGAEYNPRTTTDDGLGWMRLIQHGD